ncbi:MAG: sulfite exporter TauE/SafE family protein [Desulfovibrionaceae bacterium]|nr:sulfite exporter TauE/SafE family protein [Desulfovibrionaceae bacterium]
MLVALSIYLACGAVAGILAGLLGVGGGIVIVPMLLAVFPYQGIPDDLLQHLALGTSLASIVITSISSARAHHQRHAVHWDIVKNITPGILLGTFGGSLIASYMPTMFLKIFFICFLTLVAIKMLAKYQPKGQREMPGSLGTSLVGGGIGLISSFVGIGGGTMSVPFMTFCNVPMHEAVGTSAAIGFPIALAGTIGYILGGYNIPNLPPGCLGFVHLWALLGLATASFCTAPLGAKLSHALPTAKLKKCFAVFLLIVAFKMLYNILAN